MTQGCRSHVLQENKMPDADMSEGASSPAPSAVAILLGLLRFFASSPAEQISALNGYDTVSADKGGGPHIDDPLIELTEGLSTYCDASVSAPHHPNSFFVGPIPDNAVKVMHDLAKVTDLLLASRIENIFSPNNLSRPEWQRLRALAIEGLSQLPQSATEPLLSLFELMCYVAD
jgi:hypothetical protein